MHIAKCPHLIVLITVCFFAGCGGTKVLKEPDPIEIGSPLTTSSDHRIEAALDWVIVRDGPGTWAKNADWDEYLLNVVNRSGHPVKVLQVTVIDSTDSRIEPQTSRRSLVKGSKKTARRYRDEGLRVKAGRGAGTMLVAGAAVTAVGVGTASAVATAGILSGATSAGGGMVAASGFVLLGPALAVGGVMRGINNSRVSEEIELRQTLLPVEVPEGQELGLTIFFPLAPSPKAIEIVYSFAGIQETIRLDTSAVLAGMHFDAG